MLDNIFLWAQVIGFVGLCVNIVSWQLKNSRHILMCHIPGRTLMAIQYIMLGAPLGAVMDTLSVFRDSGLVFMKEKYILYIISTFLCAAWGIGLCFYQSWYDILPLIGVTIIGLSLSQKNNRALIARGQATSSLSFVVYNIIVGSYMGLACGLFVIASSLVGMYRHEKWVLGVCYKSFLPSLYRSLFFNFRTYP